MARRSQVLSRASSRRPQGSPSDEPGRSECTGQARQRVPRMQGALHEMLHWPCLSASFPRPTTQEVRTASSVKCTMDPGTLGIGHDTAQDTTQIPYRVAVRVGLVALFCAWICLMGFLQHGFAGVVAPSLLTVGVLVCIQVWIDKRYGLGELATVAVRVIGLSMIIGGWLYMVGSYSWSRDLSVLVICCIGAFLMVYRGPERIDRWNRIGGKLRLRWRDPAFALVTNRARRKFRLYTSTWLLTSWIASSILNLAT